MMNATTDGHNGSAHTQHLPRLSQATETAPARATRARWASTRVRQILDDAARTIQLRERGRQTFGLATLIPSLDRTLNGLVPRGFYIVSGGPGAGKTSLSVQIACEVAKHTPVVYVTYENTPDNLILKAMCRLAGIQPSAVERGRGDLNRLDDAAREFDLTIGPRLAFVEGDEDLSLDDVRVEAQAAMRHHNSDNCLVVIDYLQRMAVHMQHGSKDDNIAALSLGVRGLAKRLESPVLAISSVESGTYDMPALHHLQGNGDLEFDADVVMLLGKRQDVSLASRAAASQANAHIRLLDLLVAKNRYGEAGKIIPLLFHPTIGSFDEDTRA
jgi:replicative DNA helicase